MILVADNLQISNKEIEKAISGMNPEAIRNMVIACENAGAEAIDINAGPLSREPERKMAFLVEAVQSVTDLPILIDTANPKAMEAGLIANTKTAIINGFSLEPSKLEYILPLAKKYNTDIIGYLLYPNSHVPPDSTERLAVAIDIFSHFQKAEIDPKHLIIDPIVAPVIWKNGIFQDMEILNVLRHLPEVLGFPVRTIGGLSNLTTGRGPKAKKLLLERAYLPMLSAAGLDFALLNIFHEETVNIAKTCNVISDTKIFTWESF